MYILANSKYICCTLWFVHLKLRVAFFTWKIQVNVIHSWYSFSFLYTTIGGRKLLKSCTWSLIYNGVMIRTRVEHCYIYRSASRSFEVNSKTVQVCCKGFWKWKIQEIYINSLSGNPRNRSKVVRRSFFVFWKM